MPRYSCGKRMFWPKTFKQLLEGAWAKVGTTICFFNQPQKKVEQTRGIQ